MQQDAQLDALSPFLVKLCMLQLCTASTAVLQHVCMCVLLDKLALIPSCQFNTASASGITYMSSTSPKQQQQQQQQQR